MPRSSPESADAPVTSLSQPRRSTPPHAGAVSSRDAEALTSLLRHSGLIEAQQMGNIGRLASGVAHDLNNLLTIILGSAELARSNLAEDAAATVHLQSIQAAVRRAGDLCRAMVACTRTEPKEEAPVDLAAIVQETVRLLRTSRLAFHGVHLDLAPNLSPLPVAATQIRQILLNLLLNAAEACGDRGGRIRVSTTRLTLDERNARTLRPAPLSAGSYVRLRIADDGSGMDESTLQHLFTPFFSLKGAGRGLGLATTAEILRVLRGGLRIFSELQRGTIVDVFLPTGTARQSANPPATRSSSRRPRLSGELLIADDEETLRQPLSSFLRSQGLTVHEVSDGEAALAHVQQHPETQLLLLDRMMPGTGGLEVLQSLRAQGIDTPVILMSGNVADESDAEMNRYHPVDVVTKPFSLVELLNLISSRLPTPAA